MGNSVRNIHRSILSGWLAFGWLAVAQAATPVFVNELHYDNVGSDVGEAIEIAGPVGTDLAGWKLVLYNGSNNKVYDTRELGGLIPANCADMSAGVVVESWPQDGIQNGSPDGIALVDAGGNVVQFLSYEGTMTAADGPAAGITSTDIGVEEPGNTPVGQSLQLSGSGTQDADFHWNAPASASFGSCNPGQTFAPAVDVPPTVLSTVPANGDEDVALAADVAIQFSEPVTLGSGWVDLACDVSGAHSLAVSGNDASYTLDPTTDFANDESCVVTIHGAAVVDLDGTPDAMAADHVFSFQTVADVAPTVVSTVPADGGTLAPAGNLGVVFSEPVTLDAAWYALACDATGSHAAAVSGGPSAYTLDPAVDFEELESCTLTISASAVHDLDGNADAMPADVVVHFGIAGSGGDYYAGVDTSSGPVLLAWLHNRIKDHHSYPYSGSGTNTWVILNQADEDPNNSANILDLYANKSLAKISGGTGAYNREHTWPNSLGFPNNSRNGKPNPPYTDAHMLHLTDVDYNSKRGNKPLAECPPTECMRLGTEANDGHGGGSGDGDANWYETPDGNQGTFEIWDHRKGDIARAVMYMAVRYKGGTNAEGIVEPDLRLTDDRSQIVKVDAQTGSGGVAYMGLLSDLLAWNDLDPPDAQERLRNDLVYSYQENRNPFIDHPEWARCVFIDQDCPASNDDVIFADGFEIEATLH